MTLPWIAHMRYSPSPFGAHFHCWPSPLRPQPSPPPQEKTYLPLSFFLTKTKNNRWKTYLISDKLAQSKKLYTYGQQIPRSWPYGSTRLGTPVSWPVLVCVFLNSGRRKASCKRSELCSNSCRRYFPITPHRPCFTRMQFSPSLKWNS